MCLNDNDDSDLWCKKYIINYIENVFVFVCVCKLKLI